ncbi:hypothetical protein RQP46_003590 [Phenoliferia psychrophenolica]
MASMSKAVSSLAALILVERHSVDLDSNDALSEVLPELKLGNGGATDWIWEGGMDEAGKRKKRRATVGITLRHLLLHCAGFGYDFTTEEIRDETEPLGSIPPLSSGAIAAFDIPRVFESGTAFLYGCSTDWIGQFIIRLSGLTLREAYQTLVFTPLGVKPGALDSFVTTQLHLNRSTVAAKISEGQFVAIPVELTPQYEGTPPEGFATLASAALLGTLPAYATVIESFLHGSAPAPRLAVPNAKPLISPALWADATSDGLAKLGLSLPTPCIKTTIPQFSADVGPIFPAPAGDADGGAGDGWTMLQTAYNRQVSATGMSVGTHGWAGIANSYFFVDAEAGVGGVILAQFLPFWDAGMLEAREEFGRLVFEFGRD